MLALVKSAPAAGLELVDIAVPQIGPGDVLVKVSATGICGTDLHIEAWDAWAQKAVAVPVRSATSSPGSWPRSDPR